MDTNNNYINYWHIIAFSKELKPKQSLKKRLYDLPILLWRDQNYNVHALADVCSHKKSPLEVSCFHKNELTCPYHGWRYDEQGKLLEIPSSINVDLKKLNCRLQKFEVKEIDGNIWVLIGDEAKNSFIDINELLTLNGKWKSISLQQIFKTNVEQLIDNFMDSTHTSFTHKGIIRGHGKKVTHTVKVVTNAESVRAEFAESKEKIGLGLRFILGKNLLVKHTDSFLFPNIVKVDYYFNNVHRFNALIVCSQVSEGVTEANIRLSYNFKLLNPFISLILPRIARKVIAQDVEITELQYINSKTFSNQKEMYSECDLIHNKVKLVRKSAIECKEIKESETTIHFKL